ncbi:C39 family peptidase [Mycobacterium sp. AMU20-3851]|uniref:C39 family peptidase n=1 Tax=Mycobacterium sp. AMU20-3851 TaxID=3122055 RepID=UPI0037551D29
MSEKILPYDRTIVVQETPFWCGPASTQVVLNSRGIREAEGDLARAIGTTTAGTDFIGLIERVLDKKIPDARYTSVNMPNDPPTAAQRDKLWSDIVDSINSGFGAVMNWVAPPSNYPRGVKGSASPKYRGGTVFHYVACMGYDDTPGGRALWIADSGFDPFNYWISFDQAATLIPPKGYCYADVDVNPLAPDSPSDQTAEILMRAMGGSVSFDRYRALLPAVSRALQESDCTSEGRIAMWLAQIGHESGGLKYMEEIADGSAYEGRRDLGNLQHDDGRRFKGRGPIQVTGRHNYTQVSQWAHSRGLVPSPTFFVDSPELLGNDEFGFLGAVWYWTVARPDINAQADADDLEGVTRRINGGVNGLEDRMLRWNRCRAMGSELKALLTPTTQTGDIAMTDAQEIRNATTGTAANGWPFEWRFAYSRHPRAFNQIVDDPERGPWNRRQPDGTEHAGHTDAFEQIVPINEQIAWRHVFSDGVERDSGDVLLELMEFAIQWRSANGLPPSAFVESEVRTNGNGNGRPIPRKRPAAKAAKKAPAKRVPQ